MLVEAPAPLPEGFRDPGETCFPLLRGKTALWPRSLKLSSHRIAVVKMRTTIDSFVTILSVRFTGIKYSQVVVHPPLFPKLSLYPQIATLYSLNSGVQDAL